MSCTIPHPAGSNVQVLGAHVAKTTAKMALEGEYTKARTKALVNQRLVQRVGWVRSVLCTSISNCCVVIDMLMGVRMNIVLGWKMLLPWRTWWMTFRRYSSQCVCVHTPTQWIHRQTHTLHTIVPLSLQKERITFGRSYSDEECEDELVPMATKSAASSMQKLAPKVRKKVNDIGYNILLLTVTTESLQETWRIIWCYFWSVLYQYGMWCVLKPFRSCLNCLLLFTSNLLLRLLLSSY